MLKIKYDFKWGGKKKDRKPATVTGELDEIHVSYDPSIQVLTKKTNPENHWGTVEELRMSLKKEKIDPGMS